MPKHVPKKYCSILTFIEHHNRDLYDAIHDLCNLMGAFHQRHDKPITFIMPPKNSKYCKNIINLTYGDNPIEAIELIKPLILNGLFISPEDFTVGQEISHKGSKTDKHIVESVGSKKVKLDNGLIFVKNENFISLYIPQKISVLTMDSYEEQSVYGGAPAEIKENQEMFIRKRDLFNHMFDKTTSRMTLGSQASALMGDDGCPFVRIAVSFWEFAQDKGLPCGIHPNPMSIVPVLAMYVDNDMYKEWLNASDGNLKYTYQKYLELMSANSTKSNQVEESFIVGIAEKIKTNTIGILDDVQKMYEGDTLKMAFDECCFVMNGLADAVNTKDFNKFNALRGVIKKYTTSGTSSTPIILSDIVMRDAPPAVVARVYEFVKSDSFMHPSDAGTRTVIDKDTTRKPPSLKPGEYITYNKLIRSVCGSPSSKK